MLHRFTQARKSVWLALAIFSWSGLQSQLAHGDIVTTEVLISDMEASSLKTTLSAALDRTDVVALLEEHGVSRDQAWARVSAMTDAEAQQLVAQFDELPAGGNVTLLLVIIILILLLR